MRFIDFLRLIFTNLDFVKRLYALDRNHLCQKDLEGALVSEPEIMRHLLNEPDIQASWEDM